LPRWNSVSSLICLQLALSAISRSLTLITGRGGFRFNALLKVLPDTVRSVPLVMPRMCSGEEVPLSVPVCLASSSLGSSASLYGSGVSDRFGLVPDGDRSDGYDAAKPWGVGLVCGGEPLRMPSAERVLDGSRGWFKGCMMIWQEGTVVGNWNDQPQSPPYPQPHAALMSSTMFNALIAVVLSPAARPHSPLWPLRADARSS
jgi:hypothetical protein